MKKIPAPALAWSDAVVAAFHKFVVLFASVSGFNQTNSPRATLP